MKFATVHMQFWIQDLAAVLAYIEEKQTQGKKISRHDCNNLNGDVSFNKFVKMFDILLYF